MLQVEPGTGEVRHAASLDRDVPFSTDLASDEDGDLWLSAGDALYRLDPETGQTTLVAQTEGQLVAVAAWRGALLGILESLVDDPRPAKSHTVMDLVEIDRIGGHVTIVRSLADLSERAQHSGGLGRSSTWRPWTSTAMGICGSSR